MVGVIAQWNGCFCYIHFLTFLDAESKSKVIWDEPPEQNSMSDFGPGTTTATLDHRRQVLKKAPI